MMDGLLRHSIHAWFSDFMQTLKTTREGQITSRFNDAVSHLGEDSLPKRQRKPAQDEDKTAKKATVAPRRRTRHEKAAEVA